LLVESWCRGERKPGVFIAVIQGGNKPAWIVAIAVERRKKETGATKEPALVPKKGSSEERSHLGRRKRGSARGRRDRIGRRERAVIVFAIRAFAKVGEEGGTAEGGKRAATGQTGSVFRRTARIKKKRRPEGDIPI